MFAVIVALSDKTPADLGEEFLHITDSQDMQAIEDHYPNHEEFNSYLVSVDDGDYSAVYGTYDRFNLHDNSRLYRLTLSWL